jgi:hypothetical protein
VLHQLCDHRLRPQVIAAVVIVSLIAYSAVEALHDAIQVGYQLQLVLNVQRQLPSRSHTPFTPGVERSSFS